MKKIISFSLFIATALAVLSTGACGKDDKLDCSKYNSTYNSNMKAIIDAKCAASCHIAGGSAEGSGIYTSYNAMKPALDKMWAEVKAGRMPQPGSPELTDAEKEAFECWSNAGFPEN